MPAKTLLRILTKQLWVSIVRYRSMFEKLRNMGRANSFINRLKTRWEIKSTWQVVIILIVFSCTGFSVLYVEKLVYDFLDLPKVNHWYISMLLFMVITLPLYNLLLLFYGFIFGQFRFFWNFEKRFFSRIFELMSGK